MRGRIILLITRPGTPSHDGCPSEWPAKATSSSQIGTSKRTVAGIGSLQEQAETNFAVRAGGAVPFSDVRANFDDAFTFDSPEEGFMVFTVGLTGALHTRGSSVEVSARAEAA